MSVDQNRRHTEDCFWVGRVEGNLDWGFGTGWDFCTGLGGSGRLCKCRSRVVARAIRESGFRSSLLGQLGGSGEAGEGQQGGNGGAREGQQGMARREVGSGSSGTCIRLLFGRVAGIAF